MVEIDTVFGVRSLQEIHSLPTKITYGLNYVGNYRRNIDGTKHIIFSTFLLPFTNRIPTENYRRKCSVGNFRAVISALYIYAYFAINITS